MNEPLIKEIIYQQMNFTAGLIKAFGMLSENLQAHNEGRSVPYNELSFEKIIEEYRIYHNAVIDSIFRL